MKTPEKYGIVTVLIITPILVLFAYFTNGGDVEGKMYESYEPYIASFLASGIIAVVVWALTTSRDRRARRYVRKTNAEEYAKCVAIILAVLEAPGRIGNQQIIDDMITRTKKFLNNISDRSKTYAGVLDPKEVKSFQKQQESRDIIFEGKIFPSDKTIITAYYDFFRVNLSEYVKEYEISGFSRYVVRG